jgi:hypothetical protein
MEQKKLIHCIGDSHASFFSGYDRIQPGYPEPSDNKYPFFTCYRLGAVLAYNLPRSGTKEQGREKLLQLLSALPQNATVLLCFGEIDCRCHLLKQAEVQGKPIDDIVTTCIESYFRAIDEIVEKGFEVIVWNAVPSSNTNNEEYPVYGSLEARNKCTVLFNRHLEKECKSRNLFFLSIYQKLLDKDLKTDFIYYFDSIHLGQLAMPMVLQELYKFRPEISQHYNRFQVKYMLFKSMLIRTMKSIKRAVIFKS